MDAQKETRFEFTDPTNGDYGTAYSGKTKAEIIEKAEKVGASRFNEIGPDGAVTAHVKVDDQWQLATDVERKQNATAAIEAMSRQIQNGLQQNEAGARQTPEQLAELESAFRDFGGDMKTDSERRAAIGIEARSIAFANAVSDAKHDKFAALPADDIAARLEESRRLEPNVLPADVSRQWATLDAQEFAKIESQERREASANSIAANMAANPEYKAAMEEAAPAVAAAARDADAETNRGIERKAMEKAMEAEAMAAAANRDADAFELVRHESRTLDAGTAEKTPAEALQAMQDRAQGLKAEGLDIEDLTAENAARLAREDQADYAKLDTQGKAEMAHVIADNLRNRAYSAEFVRHDPEAAQDVVREVSRQADAEARPSWLDGGQEALDLAREDGPILDEGPAPLEGYLVAPVEVEPAPTADPFADPQPAQPATDKEAGTPMASMPGHRMVYNDEPGMAGAEIHTPDGQVIAFGGKAAIEQYAAENNLAAEDKQTLLDLDAMADKHRGAGQGADKGFDEQDKNATWDAAALARMEQARSRDFAEVREAMGLNSIEPNIEREQQRLEGEAEAGRQAWLAKAAAAPETAPKGPQQGAAPGGNGVESDEIFTATQGDAKAVIPAEIEKQYLRVGDKFYHPKNTDLVAFEDKGNKLETKSNSEAIAESMVRIAEARGWDEIKVTGSETFRREVWLEAASRGMHVKGYTPSEQDKAALAAKTHEVGKNAVEKGRPANVGYGTPGYDGWEAHNPRQEFRARETEKGADTPNKQRADAFAKETPAEAVKKYPELAGAAAAVAAMDKKAEADGLNPAQRAVVAARVKQNVVNAIERGDVPEVKVRDQVEKKVEANNSREYAR